MRLEKPLMMVTVLMVMLMMVMMMIFMLKRLNLHHEIGEAIDDGDALGAFYRLRVCVHHPERLHNPLDPEKIFNHRANHCSNFKHICKVSSAVYVLNELIKMVSLLHFTSRCE